MRKERLQAVSLILCFALLLLLAGCCGYTDAAKKAANGANQSVAVAPQANRPPVVRLNLSKDSGPAPLSLTYTYNCYDPEGKLVSCELKVDGQTFAKGANATELFGPDYSYPDFYSAARRKVGNHTLEIYAVDAEGLSSSKVVTFIVLKPAPISEPGWYRCNNLQDTEPCDTMLAAYCGKFNPTDLQVREAVAQAISRHPGQFSINQLLDIYDWVHTNVFYHNVPLDMYPPYYPNETLATASGDCKNQAMLIASMVEAIGGSARVLLVPDCHHAFAEVYLGSDADVSNLNDAIWAHYPTHGKSVNWHTTRGPDNETEYWFIFDTAGGSFPGNTIAECINASYTFEIRDCSRGFEELNAPISEGTAYEQHVKINDTKVIYAGWGQNYWWDPSPVIPRPYRWCHYKAALKSLSPGPLDWYLTDEEGYENSQAHRSFSFYYSEEQVHEGNYEFDWDNSDKFYILIKNSGQSSITTNLQLTETCYKD